MRTTKGCCALAAVVALVAVLVALVVIALVGIKRGAAGEWPDAYETSAVWEDEPTPDDVMAGLRAAPIPSRWDR